MVGVAGVSVNPEDQPQIHYEMSGDDDLNVTFAVTAGPHIVGVSFVNLDTAKPETPYPGRMPVASIANFSNADGLMDVDTVQLAAVETAATPSDTPSRERIFVCHPAGTADEAACAEKILSKLARLAYRRPVTDSDLKPLLDMYRGARKNLDFDEGIETAMERILIAPEFLFRIEEDPPKIPPSTVYRITDLDLASRLSFFLWSSIPDDELLAVAERGKLHDPAVLEQQVKRMLADRRSMALITNFEGGGSRAQHPGSDARCKRVPGIRRQSARGHAA